MLIAADQETQLVYQQIFDMFISIAPDKPVGLLNSLSTSRLTTLAIRERSWIEIPKSTEQTDLLDRYTIVRSGSPKFIIDDDPFVQKHLFSILAPYHQADFLPVANTAVDAFNLAMNGRELIFFNFPRHLPINIDTTILIYAFNPTIIAILLKMALGNSRKFKQTEVNQQFTLVNCLNKDKESLQNFISSLTFHPAPTILSNN